MRLRCEVPPELAAPEMLDRREPDYAKIAELCRRFEFNKILRDLPQAPAPKPESTAPEKSENAATYEQGSLF